MIRVFFDKLLPHTNKSANKSLFPLLMVSSYSQYYHITYIHCWTYSQISVTLVVICYNFNGLCYISFQIIFYLSLVALLLLNNSTLRSICSTVLALLFKLSHIIPTIADIITIWLNFLSLLNTTYESPCSASFEPKLIQYFSVNVPPCAFHTIQPQESFNRI